MKIMNQNKIHKLTAPVYIYLPRKTKKWKKISVSLNWFRNAHYIEINKTKIEYKKLMAAQVQLLPPFKKIRIAFRYFSPNKRKSDLDNFCVIQNKFICDTLVGFKKIPEDNYDFVPETRNYYGGLDPDKKGKVEIYIQEIE